jgi:hypothetical protein
VAAVLTDVRETVAFLADLAGTVLRDVFRTIGGPEDGITTRAGAEGDWVG